MRKSGKEPETHAPVGWVSSGGKLGENSSKAAWFDSAGRTWRRAGSPHWAEGGEGECSRRGVGDRALNSLRLGAYQWPRVCGKEDDSDIPAGKILLEDEVLVGGNKRLETGLFGFVEQLPVREACPAHLTSGPHVMTWQKAAHASRGVRVEQNPHPFEGGMILAKRSTPFTRSMGKSNISVAISSAEQPARALSTTA
jgi:hypothetical protein